MTISVNLFFGDKERTFHLTPTLVEELQRQTGVGLGVLCKRVFDGDFSQADVFQTIRLGLIGGGATPQDAATLVKVYAEEAPLNETYPLAVSILEARWFGVSAKAKLGEEEDKADAMNDWVAHV